MCHGFYFDVTKFQDSFYTNLLLLFLGITFEEWIYRNLWMDLLMASRQDRFHAERRRGGGGGPFQFFLLKNAKHILYLIPTKKQLKKTICVFFISPIS